MPPGCEVLLTAPDQREHLPEDLLTDRGTSTVTNGQDIATAIAAA